MSGQDGSGNLLRRIGAVLAGLLAVVLLSTGVDLVMHATGVFPPWGQPMSDGLFLLAFLYRTVIGVFGGYLTARLAPLRPMQHAVILGVLGFVLSVVGAAATWGKGTEFGPKWYPLALVAIAIPSSWFGGKLFAKPSTVLGRSHEQRP